MSFPHSLTYYLKSIVFGPFRFFAGLTRSVFKSSTFEIKPGYIHRKKVFPHDDRGHKDENQKEVYLKASAWMHLIDEDAFLYTRIFIHDRFYFIGTSVEYAYTAHATVIWYRANNMQQTVLSQFEIPAGMLPYNLLAFGSMDIWAGFKNNDGIRFYLCKHFHHIFIGDRCHK